MTLVMCVPVLIKRVNSIIQLAVLEVMFVSALTDKMRGRDGFLCFVYITVGCLSCSCPCNWLSSSLFRSLR